MTGQLSLFGGKRQRGRKAPAPKEFKLHVVLADLLRDWCMPGWIWSHFPAGELRDRATVIRKGKAVTFSPSGARLKRMGTKKGWPDFQFFSVTGKVAFLELKRAGETTSDDQDQIIDHLKRAGHAVKVAYSVGEASAFLKGIGVLRAGVHVQ